MRILSLVSLFILMSIVPIHAQVGIGTTNPDTSSMLDVVSTDSGILIPRLTVTERINITSPAEALLVYQTDDVSGFYYFNGTQWVRLADNPRDTIPTGAIFAFPTATPPDGYLECNGSAVSRTTYANLFALIGTSYGSGDGTTTFNLPDYRGEFLRGFSNGSGNDPNALSRLDRGDGTTGDNIGTKQNNQTLSHLHGVDPPPTNVSNNGYHSHSIQPRNFTTNNSGAHAHLIQAFNMNSSTSGYHYHPITYESTYVTTSVSGGTYIRQLIGATNSGTGSSGSHNHSVYFPSRYTNSSGSHNHSVTINNLTINSSGNHTHNLNIPSFNSTSSGGSESRPRNVSVLWSIKY
ncbi:phage tail protein [Psychroserpens algicola]|uniref:phage tail protein n=1 Tax=Psychroserpens algicola TaxID=1719034 RepID=UPI0019549CBB|nr:phage tail protein [Psychroserpens algicola]